MRRVVWASVPTLLLSCRAGFPYVSPHETGDDDVQVEPEPYDWEADFPPPSEPSWFLGRSADTVTDEWSTLSTANPSTKYTIGDSRAGDPSQNFTLRSPVFNSSSQTIILPQTDETTSETVFRQFSLEGEELEQLYVSQGRMLESDLMLAADESEFAWLTDTPLDFACTASSSSPEMRIFLTFRNSTSKISLRPPSRPALKRA